MTWVIGRVVNRKLPTKGVKSPYKGTKWGLQPSIPIIKGIFGRSCNLIQMGLQAAELQGHKVCQKQNKGTLAALYRPSGRWGLRTLGTCRLERRGPWVHSKGDFEHLCLAEALVVLFWAMGAFSHQRHGGGHAALAELRLGPQAGVGGADTLGY